MTDSQSVPPPAPPAPPPSPAAPERRPNAGRRAVVNTAYRAGGEVIGRFASLLLFAEAGHYLGQSGFGAFVFAMALMGTIMALLGLGLDRYMLRLIAERQAAQDGLFYNVLLLKLAVAIPGFGLTLLILYLLGFSGQTQALCWVLAPGVLCDSLARTQLSVFSAHERGGPPATADSIQRALSAVLGILALRTGYGVVAIGASYSIGSAAGVLIGFVLMARSIRLPSFTVSVRGWRALASRSLPFASQDILVQLLSRADALILALLATQDAVGLYGAAYRMFDTTLFIPYALIGAFSAMYTYLDAKTSPTLADVFHLSVKLAVVLLMPFTVAFLILARPICRLIYGPQFVTAAASLRLLGLAVLLNGLVTVTTSLIVARGNPWRISRPTVVVLGANVALNFALIPVFGAAGAAAAMFATEVIYMVWLARLATADIGRVRWLSASVSTLAAGACMIAVCLLLRDHLWLALFAGSAVYLVVLAGVELRINPRIVDELKAMARQRSAALRA